LYHFRDIARYWSEIAIFSYPFAYDAPFVADRLEWCGYPMVKKLEDMISRLGRITACDRQTNRGTDRPTDRHIALAYPRYAYALRGETRDF